MLKKKIKKKWLKAMRSGKYKQTTQSLHDSKGYCCLGVLTDLYLKEKGKSWEEKYPANKEGEHGWQSTLDGKVAEWAFKPIYHGCDDAQVEVEEGTHCLAELNDAGYTFNEIADLIEAQL